MVIFRAGNYTYVHKSSSLYISIKMVHVMNSPTLIDILDEKKRQIKVENLSISINEIYSMYQNNELILRPEYQRLLKWKEKQKTLFIESLLLGFPTPSIFISVDDDGKWEIVDGLQRLSTIFDFIGDLRSEDTKDIPLYKSFKELDDNLVYLSSQYEDSNGEKNSGFIGKRFKDFPQKIQLELKRQRINVVILLSGTHRDIKYELFQRINEGSSPIKPMDFRRAILLSRENDELLSKIDEVCKGELYNNLLDDSFDKSSDFKKESSIMYFLSLHGEINHIIENSIRIKNIDAYITEYARTLDKQKAIDNLDTFTEILTKIDSLELDNPKKIFTGNNTYSDTIFGTIMLGIAINLNNLPDDSVLKEKIQSLTSNEEFKSYYKRGLSASARIPKMLFFCKKYFSKSDQ